MINSITIKCHICGKEVDIEKSHLIMSSGIEVCNYLLCDDCTDHSGIYQIDKYTVIVDEKDSTDV